MARINFVIIIPVAVYLCLANEREREREEESVKLSKLGIEKKTCYINLPWQKEG